MGAQQRLFEFRMGERSPETLVVSDANRDAATLLADWRNWPTGALALIGPPGAGKTHLALAWAMEVGARQIDPRSKAPAASALFRACGGRVLVDGAAGGDETMLWRLLDLARVEGGALLLTDAANPVDWKVTIPDLRSRLASLPVARLKEPDEALMTVILRRVCREQFIRLGDDAVRYLAARLPRTYAAAQAWAATLDEALVRGAKPVSLALARASYKKACAQHNWVGDHESHG